jgi:endonuclease/exonuclease/phosphatase family metal-dependent hydrolase
MSAGDGAIGSSGSRSSDGVDCLRTRRLLHWNILDGGGSRRKGIARVLREGAYDIVTMNELNDFTAASFAHFGRQVGMGHTMFLAKSRYHIGVLSRHPLHKIAKETGSEFMHGLLCVRVLGLGLCVTHLNPHSSAKRAAEARAIVERYAEPELTGRRPFMLVGDLNTLSPIDRVAHEAAGLKNLIGNGPFKGPLSKKFLDAERTAIDYTPMQVLLDAPLHDIGAGGGHSVPTAINADKMHFASLRLDYCLVSDGLIEAGVCPPDKGWRKKKQQRRQRPTATLLLDEKYGALSDHFPLEVRFWLAESEPHHA